MSAIDTDIGSPTEATEKPAKKQTEVIAIYGKGGIGKSFTLANLSHMMAEMGKRVLLIGCDPKSDTTSLLFGGKACPTIIETSTKKKLAGEEVKIGDVCFKRGGVFAMELGGPEVGRGCGGRGIIHGFELLEKLGFHDWDFDYVLLDFLGDVVCGGFGLPIARDMAQKVILVASNDLQSLYVALAPPVRPTPVSQDGLLALFSAEVTGADFVLTPATDADMRGKNAVEKKSLEVVYDNV